MFTVATALCACPLWHRRTCYPVEAAEGSSSLSGTWCAGCCSSTGPGSDRFNAVTALLSDVTGAEIKLQQLKSVALLAGWRVFQLY